MPNLVQPIKHAFYNVKENVKHQNVNLAFIKMFGIFPTASLLPYYLHLHLKFVQLTSLLNIPSKSPDTYVVFTLKNITFHFEFLPVYIFNAITLSIQHKEEWHEMIKTIVALFFGPPDNLLYALIVIVVLDYITGVCAAVHTKTLSSKTGAKGIAKKVTIFAVISLAHVVDKYFLQLDDTIRTLTTTFYIANECISVLENVGNTGLPIPSKLQQTIKSLTEDKPSTKT